MFAFLSDEKYIWSLVIVLMLGASYNYYNTKSERPFFNDDLAILYNITNAAYLYVNAVLFLCVLLRNTIFAGGVQLIVLGVPLVGVVEFFSKHPKYYWVTQDFQLAANGEECFKSIRYLNHIRENDIEPDNRSMLEGFIKSRLEFSSNPNSYIAVYKANYATRDANSKRIMSSRLALNYYIRNLYKSAVKRFPDHPELRIHYAFFLAEITEDSVKARKQLRKAQLSHPRIDGDFVIFRYCRIIEEKLTESRHKGEISMDRVSLIAYENYFRQCKFKMKEAAKLHMDFWAGINAQVPDLAQLIKIAGKINRVITDIEEYWGLMESLNTNMSKAIRHYAKFLHDILGDEDAAREILKNIKQDHGRKSGKDSESKSGSEYGRHFIEQCSNDGMPCLLISGLQNSLGIIINSNKSTSRIFGYTYTQLVGSHMDILLPPLLRDHHNKLMKKTNENPETFKLLNKEKTVTCQLSNGYILIASKLIKAVPSFANNMNFVVTFKLDRNQQVKNTCYLLIDIEGNIKSISGSKISGNV